MGSNVFVNGLEVSCEKADNQSLASMPDVCLSPPSPPAGPVPVPYPNFASASDTTEGTKTVQIKGGQVGMKNQSYYKQSKGDEAATKSLGMGVTTGCIQGKCYFEAWSSDVKFEGANAVRLSDLTTSNSASPGGCSANTTVSTGSPDAGGNPSKCEELQSKNTQQQATTLRPSAAHNNYASTTSSYEPPTSGPFAGNQGLGGLAGFKPAFSTKSRVQSGALAGYADKRQPGETKGCSGEEYGMIRENHTEPKLMERIFEKVSNASGPPGSLGTLTMNINYVPAGTPPGTPPSHWVCDSCKSGICKAIECGLDIKLCENGGEVSTEEINERCESGEGWPPQP